MSTLLIIAGNMLLVKKEGFTLIELLVVIALLGLLISSLLFLINPSAQFDKARDASRKNDLVQIRNVLEQYYHDHNRYPPLSSPPAASVAGWNCANNSALSTLNYYMSTLPADPARGAINCPCYLYSVPSDGQVYSLFAHLDGQNDFDALKTKPQPAAFVNASFDASTTEMVVLGGVCGGSTFNYWFNNP